MSRSIASTASSQTRSSAGSRSTDADHLRRGIVTTVSIFLKSTLLILFPPWAPSITPSLPAGFRRRGARTYVVTYRRSECNADMSPPACSPSFLSVSASGPLSLRSVLQDWAYCRRTSSMMVPVSARPTKMYRVHNRVYLGFSYGNNDTIKPTCKRAYRPSLTSIIRYGRERKQSRSPSSGLIYCYSQSHLTSATRRIGVCLLSFSSRFNYHTRS